MLKEGVLEATSVAGARAVLESRRSQRFVLHARDLRIAVEGTLTHTGTRPVEELRRVPMTDVALDQLNHLVGVPARYALTIEPALHAHSVNELLTRSLAIVTVVVENDDDNGASRRVIAVLPGARGIVPNEIVLDRLIALGIDGEVTLARGAMDVSVGAPEVVEVLPGDAIQVRATLHSDPFGQAGRAMLEASAFLLRLVCANGAVAQRHVAAGRLGSGSRGDVERFVDRQVDRVLSFPRNLLVRAAARMAGEILDDEQREEASRLITRHAGADAAHDLLEGAVSVYAAWNAITAAAHRARTAAGKRRLQVAGGEVLDRYVAAIAGARS